MLMFLKVEIMLRLASRPAYHLLWLSPVAFINSNQGYSSYATTTGSAQALI